MANLRRAMDTGFWDVNISTPKVLDGVSKAIPGDPIPLDGAISSRALRIQQISLLSNGFPLGIIPSFSSSLNSSNHNKEENLGSFALQSLLGKAELGNWWLGLLGQFRPTKLISSIKADVSTAEKWNLPLLKHTTKHFLDKSLYAIGLCSQISLSPSSSLLFTTEKHGENKNRRSRAMLSHKLPDHNVTLEAAWPELFIDKNGKYWEVPESVSLDCSSLVSDSGLRYRFGVHKNSGHPQAVNPTTVVDAETPLALLPGMGAKASFSYEKSKDFWRQKETKEDVLVETDKGQIWRPAFDIRLREPHAAVSGIIGATCSAWLGDGKGPLISGLKDRGRVSGDLFGSLCSTFQFGKFRKPFGDLTRVDTRLDIGSASALAKDLCNFFKTDPSNRSPNALSSPKLSLILQQQVVGPVLFRVDSRFALESSSKRHIPKLEDLIYSLSYSLPFLGSGKVVAWYSPKREEGMVELRLFEF